MYIEASCMVVCNGGVFYQSEGSCVTVCISVRAVTQLSYSTSWSIQSPVMSIIMHVTPERPSMRPKKLRKKNA